MRPHEASPVDARRRFRKVVNIVYHNVTTVGMTFSAYTKSLVQRGPRALRARRDLPCHLGGWRKRALCGTHQHMHARALCTNGEQPALEPATAVSLNVPGVACATPNARTSVRQVHWASAGSCKGLRRAGAPRSSEETASPSACSRFGNSAARCARTCDATGNHTRVGRVGRSDLAGRALADGEAGSKRAGAPRSSNGLLPQNLVANDSGSRLPEARGDDSSVCHRLRQRRKCQGRFLCRECQT